MTDKIQRAFQLLEVPESSKPEAVKQAYREMVKVWHPDRFGDDGRLQLKAQEKLKAINLAYAVLEEFFSELKQEASGQRESTEPSDISSAKQSPIADEYLRRGHAFHTGTGCPKSFEQAAKCYRMAAQAGSAEAQYRLGMLFYSGDGVSKSMTEAGELLKLAARQFHPQAMHALGWLYSDGFEAPASTKAMGFAIGLLVGGIHVGDGKIEAYRWFNLAATHGYAKAYTGMRQMAFSMSWAQINDARTRAMPLYPHYAASTPRQVLTGIFRFWVDELRRGRKVLPYDTASALLSKFESVEEHAIEALFLRLEAEFLGRAKPKREGDRFYFKNATSAKEAGWCLAEMMSWEKQNLDLYSPEFICAEQNALNQIWLMLYRGLRS